MRISDRKPLYPSIGELYPEATELLADAGDEASLGAALDAYPVYRKIWEVHQSEGVDNKSIDDAFYERDVQMSELAFQSQMHFGTIVRACHLLACLFANLVACLSASCLFDTRTHNCDVINVQAASLRTSS